MLIDFVQSIIRWFLLDHLSACSYYVDFFSIIRWFHPGLNRHQAEAELINAEEGVYLLRPIMKDSACEGYSLDVR